MGFVVEHNSANRHVHFDVFAAGAVFVRAAAMFAAVTLAVRVVAKGQ